MKKNDGINRPIFYRRNRVWHRVCNRRVAGYIFIALLGLGLGCFLDRVSNLFN
jgi:hypothetical protein